MKKNNLLLFCICALQSWMMLSCNDGSSVKIKEETPPVGEVNFSDKSGLDITEAKANVITTISIYERVDRDDILELSVQATSVDWGLNATILEQTRPPENGITLDKEFNVGEINNDIGRPNGVVLIMNNSSTKEQYYQSVDGKITIKYSAGHTEVFFDVGIQLNDNSNMDGTDILHLSGTIISDVVELRCYALEKINDSTLVSTDEDIGTDVPSNGPPPTNPVSYDDPFCKQYL